MAQLGDATARSQLGRIGANAESSRNLLEAQTPNVMPHHWLTLVDRQLPESRVQISHVCITTGITLCGERNHRNVSERHGTPRDRAAIHEPDVASYRQNPRHHGKSGVVCVAGAMDLEKSLLHQVLDTIIVLQRTAQEASDRRHQNGIEIVERRHLAHLITRHQASSHAVIRPALGHVQSTIDLCRRSEDGINLATRR